MNFLFNVCFKCDLRERRRKKKQMQRRKRNKQQKNRRNEKKYVMSNNHNIYIYKYIVEDSFGKLIHIARVLYVVERYINYM